MKEKNTNNKPGNTKENKKLSRREILRGLSTLPVVGVFAYGLYKKWKHDRLLKNKLLSELNLTGDEEIYPVSGQRSPGKKLRLGIIGYGIRGEQLMKGLGFANPERVDEWKQDALENKEDKRYADFLAQEDLNVTINGVCDVFDVQAEKALLASANHERKGTDGKFEVTAKRYKTYKELLAAKDIDAVIIATPDHWHAQMAIDAARAGKHVYVEKGMTRTVEEAFQLREAVKNSGIILQLGHQGRQTASHKKAREIIEKDIIGKISLIEICTNRNDPNGAWVYDIDPEASPKTIDWKQFIGPTSWHPFSLERFFRWRCWWDYGTGLSGDLFTHEYDAINQVLDLGIPESAVASGGVYFYKDGREVPDVYQSVFEYPDRDLTLLYSASLSSDRFRGRVLMGHDGHMEMEENLTVYADQNSTRYREKIDSGIIDPGIPIYTYIPGRENVDAVTSATEQYFAGRGLLYTYINGRRVDTTHLHIKDWLDSIMSGKQPSCHIDLGFQEAITAHMGTIAYRENRKVYWDAGREKIV
ncbi:MAG: Gfo/Idh/MocA family oxidoreductase [Bacteroidales bacterium]|jgi:predicted dehydrogenase